MDRSSRHVFEVQRSGVGPGHAERLSADRQHAPSSRQRLAVHTTLHGHELHGVLVGGRDEYGVLAGDVGADVREGALDGRGKVVTRACTRRTATSQGRRPNARGAAERRMTCRLLERTMRRPATSRRRCRLRQQAHGADAAEEQKTIVGVRGTCGNEGEQRACCPESGNAILSKERPETRRKRHEESVGRDDQEQLPGRVEEHVQIRRGPNISPRRSTGPRSNRTRTK